MREDPKTVAHLLDLIRNSYAEYETALNSIPTDRFTEPVMGDWSVKDVVAHVLWGEREMIPVVREMRLHGSELWNLPTDQRNKRMVEDSRMQSASEIMNEQRDVHRDLIAALEQLQDADLTESARLKDAPPGWTVWELVAGNTFRHYPEHTENLKEWLESGHIQLQHDPNTKAGLIERMNRERRKLESLLKPLSEDQLTRIGPDGWSVKDHLAHLATWEAGIAALLRKQSRWQAMGLSADQMKGKSEAELNAMIEAQHKNLSVTEVRSLFERVHADLVNALDSMTDADLKLPYSEYDPAADRNVPIIESILGNTTHHWYEHRGWINELLNS